MQLFRDFQKRLQEDPTWVVVLVLVGIVIAGVVLFDQFTRLSATLDHQPVYGALTLPTTSSSSAASSKSSRRRRTSSSSSVPSSISSQK